METFNDSLSLQLILKKNRLEERTIGLVPTMGNLHAGHLSLVKAAKIKCDFVITTIFVNPLQFGPNEDLERYPRTIAEDKQQLEAAGCDAVFIPAVNEMYPNGLKSQTIISVPDLSTLHCGASRPGHFDGVCTVVNKLFNLTKPDHAFFGVKDFQQLLIIKKMSKDLCLTVQIDGIPIEREISGLALSSRNNFLTSQEKEIASNIYSSLKIAKEQIIQNKGHSYIDLEQSSKLFLSKKGLNVEYFKICNTNTLFPASEHDRQLVILTAVTIVQTDNRIRLIDNITIDLANPSD